MADVARARRLAKRIAQIVASAMEREVKDPRLARVTITDAKVTADLRDATLYYTVIGESVDAPPDVASAAAALESAKGVLRSLVGQQTGIRFTPTLTFVADTVPEAAKSMDELLARAREADAEVARIASGATFAGEADPYKSTDMDDEEEDLHDAEEDAADENSSAAEDAVDSERPADSASTPRDAADSER
ncbi:ribosome-binding factor A [Actinoalloteichus sp. GBA129-24]|uniref:Ribosome-binding factor A n=1 Tax=Actinoalloteichus fjordicus TaxID=1612552 RepID=A0AAC9LCJ0_9PSEU|nr:ribosome-binding factor A [Actinoalloteichus fjordicus]APU19861.1 ribosome-binding factor A [Actinoalloteichus sp. GBA129-24]